MKPYLASALLLVSLAVQPASAQWLNYPTPGIPRTPDGKPDLNAPAPRTMDGKPNLSGVWQFTLGWIYSTNIVADLRPDEIQPWADTLFRQRLKNLGVDDSSLVGCLPRGPRFIVGSGAVPQIVKLVQIPNVIMVLSEELAFRQIFMDGRTLRTDPNPTFMGYSVGHWDGDMLVVESNGFNDRTWLDFGGHPHTEALTITERFRRETVGKMEVEVILSDPGAYTRPWTVRFTASLMPDTDILEAVCNEQETRRLSIGLSASEKAVVVPETTLVDYVGTYEDESRSMPVKTLTIRKVGGELVLDMEGKGNVPMTPLSETMFSTRIVNIEFVRDASGIVTHAVSTANGVRLVRRR